MYANEPTFLKWRGSCRPVSALAIRVTSSAVARGARTALSILFTSQSMIFRTGTRSGGCTTFTPIIALLAINRLRVSKQCSARQSKFCFVASFILLVMTSGQKPHVTRVRLYPIWCSRIANKRSQPRFLWLINTNDFYHWSSRPISLLGQISDLAEVAGIIGARRGS